MAEDGKTPGNGNTSPFGDGSGKGGSPMAGGNNFVTNPGGTAGAGGKGQPESYGQSKPQQRGQAYDIAPQSRVAGGDLAALDPKVNPTQDPGNPIGTTPSGGGVPFKLRGA